MVWSSTGARPLFDDAAAKASAVTRDCVPDFDDADGQAPAFSVFGGKIRTYSRHAEHAIEKFMHHFPGLRKAWTGHAVRPGDAVPEAELEAFPAQFLHEAPFLPAETARRPAQAYGTEARALFGGSSALAALEARAAHNPGRRLAPRRLRRAEGRSRVTPGNSSAPELA